jgi:hypothetical protein
MAMDTSRGRVTTGLAATFAALTLAVLPVTVSAQQAPGGSVYKWMDPQGGLHYSDHPPPPEGKLVGVERAPSSPSPTTSRATAPRPSTGDDTAHLRPAVDADVAKVSAEQCRQATERYQADIHSRRLFKQGADNQRIYLSDSEIEQERLDAKRDVDMYCGADSQ